MQCIRNKLTKINEYWNEYYFKKQFFQKKIKFNDEVKSNYYGDLNNYFIDTLPIIESFIDIYFENRRDYISKITILLQTIYVHQDLLDELLSIFKLDKSSAKDKNPNRQIRNELVGHPISRDKNGNLKSSVLFDVMNITTNKLQYYKYSKEKKFHPEKLEYSISEIIENHSILMNKYLDVIIKKMEDDENKYKKLLKRIFEIPLNKQFDYIDKIDANLISEIDYIFECEFLKYYYSNIRKHRRYLYCIKRYKETLLSIIEDRDMRFYKSSIEIYDNEQLRKKDTFFSIDKIKKRYKDNPIVYFELEHMENNINDDKEYYASLNYLEMMGLMFTDAN